MTAWVCTNDVTAARSPEKAERQSQGVDVMADMIEKDEAGFTETYDPNTEPGEFATASADENAGDDEEA